MEKLLSLGDRVTLKPWTEDISAAVSEQDWNMLRALPYLTIKYTKSQWNTVTFFESIYEFHLNIKKKGN